MTHLFKMVRVFIGAMMLAGIALPSNAANGPDGSDKTFSLDVDPHPTVAGAVLAIFTNQGNSSFNSLTIDAPSGLEFTGTPTSTRGTAVIVSASRVKVTDINLPTGAGQHVDLTLPVKVTTCAGEAGDWTAQPYAGSGLTGQRFNLSTSVISDVRAGISGVCVYSYTIDPSTNVNVGATSARTAKFTNSSTSTASFNSVTITAPTGGWKIKVGTVANWTPSTTAYTTSVTLTGNGATAIAAAGTLSVPLDVSVPCSASSGTWSSAVTGAIGAFAAPPSNPLTGVNGPCKLTVTSPVDVVAGTPFTVEVKAFDGGGLLAIADLKCTDVTVSKYSGSGTLGEISGTCTDTGGVVTKTLKIDGTGPFVLTASSSYGGASLSINTSSFTVVGEINCNGTLGYLNPGNLPELYAAANVDASPIPVSGWAGDGRRGRFNKDGRSCVKVDYTFTNNILVDNSVILEWDTDLQPNAAFRFSMNWKPEWANPTTGLPNVSATKVKWKVKSGINWVWSPLVDGRACLSSQLPAPYGTLTYVTGDSTSGTITIGSALSDLPVPTVFPFPVFIGDGTKTERLLVTGPASGASTYNVQRAQGGTTAVDLSALTNNALVVSNPLPLDGSSMQMQVCLADQVFVSVPANQCTAPAPITNTANPPGPPPACMVLTTTVFDIGDGGISRFSE